MMDTDTATTERYALAVERLLEAQQHEKALEIARAHHTRRVWVADDGNAEVEYEVDSYSASEAADEYVADGDWGNIESTSWVEVYVFPRYIMADGTEVDDLEQRECHTVSLAPDEPECSHDDGHDWQAPLDIVGGINENPGCWGNGGGVIYHECCMRCGCQRITNTWAQNRETGEQGLTSVSYEPGHYAADLLDTSVVAALADIREDGCNALREAAAYAVLAARGERKSVKRCPRSCLTDSQAQRVDEVTDVINDAYRAGGKRGARLLLYWMEMFSTTEHESDAAMFAREAI